MPSTEGIAPGALNRDPGPGLRRRRKAAAVFGSVLFHLLVFAAIFGTASGDLVSGAAAAGGTSGPVFTVTLVTPQSIASSHGPAGTQETLQPLFAKFGANPIEVAPPTKKPGASELDELAQRLRARNASAPQEARRQVPETAPSEAKRADGKDGKAETAGETSSTGSTGALWGRIEPCWRRIAGGVQVPVTLEVALDATGGVSKPPKILRGQTARLDEERLSAEAQALSALAACLPRGDLRFSGRVYKLEFRPVSAR